MNRLRGLGLMELVIEAQRIGIELIDLGTFDPHDGTFSLLTKDAIRVKIIDAVIDRELDDG